MKTIIAISIGLAFALAHPTLAQATDGSILPTKRTITAADGRKISGIVLSKNDNEIRFRRASDGKEFNIALDKLTNEDRHSLVNLQNKEEQNSTDQRERRILYHLTADAVLDNDLRTIDALEDAGYRVDVSSMKSEGSWEIHDFEIERTAPNAYGFKIKPTGKRLQRDILPESDVEIKNYQVLFVGISSILGSSSSKTQCDNWVKAMHQQQGAIAINTTSRYFSEEEYLTVQKKRDKWRIGKNFANTRGRFIAFNNQSNDWHKLLREGKPNYDPEITKEVIRKIKGILN